MGLKWEYSPEALLTIPKTFRMQDLSVTASGEMSFFSFLKPMPYVFLNSPLKKNATPTPLKFRAAYLPPHPTDSSELSKVKSVLPLMAGALPSVMMIGDGCAASAGSSKQHPHQAINLERTN